MSHKSSIKTILVYVSRNHALVNDEHTFVGSISFLDESGDVLHSYSFENALFHQYMTLVAGDLRETPDAQVVIQRRDRAGIPPMPLQEELRVLLRDDPVAAIDAMNIRVGQKGGGKIARLHSSEFDWMADLFGERVFIRMQNGMLECPVTGTWRPLAYSESKQVWLLRAEHDRSDAWLPVQMPSVASQFVPNASLDTTAKVLAESCWATVSVEDLLQQPVNKFFLPRRWNTDGQWISRAALHERLQGYVDNKKESES
jgi:hypothetical protein